MISPRFATPLIVLLGMALVPTLIHSYVDVRIAESPAVAMTLPTLDGFTSSATLRSCATCSST